MPARQTSRATAVCILSATSSSGFRHNFAKLKKRKRVEGRKSFIYIYERVFQGTTEQSDKMTIAVGTVIADRPPHRSVRAALPHTALTLDGDLLTARWDKGPQGG